MKVQAIPGVVVGIHVNGIALPEFDNEADDRRASKVGVKYVEVDSGSNFSVHVHTNRFELGGDEKDHMYCDVLLDGRVVHRPLLDPYSLPFYTCDIPGHKGEIDGRVVLRRFTFADLSTHDGIVEGLKITDFKHLGEVEVRLGFCRKLRAESRMDPMISTSNDTIPEKCLKGRAISTRASLGNPEPCYAPKLTAVVDYYQGMSPAATYVFKYRSRKDLQIKGLIPRSPSPVPLEDRDPDSLTLEESRELVRRLQAREAQSSVKVKKEKRAHAELSDGEDEEDDDVVVIEERSKRAHLSTDSGVEIIDLTGD